MGSCLQPQVQHQVSFIARYIEDSMTYMSEPLVNYHKPKRYLPDLRQDMHLLETSNTQIIHLYSQNNKNMNKIFQNNQRALCEG